MPDKKTSQINLIPVIVLVLLILGAGYLLLRSDLKLPKIGESAPVVRRFNGFPTVAYTSKVAEKQRLIITSEEELNNFLNLVDSTGLLKLPETIDFNKQFVIAASTKTNATTGTTIKIRKVYQDKVAKKLQISVRQTVEDDTCEKDASTNIAVDLVAVNKLDDWEIDFDNEKMDVTCSKKSDDSDNVDTSDSSPSSN